MIIAAVVLVLCIAAVLTAMYRSGSFIKSFFITALQGLASLIAVNVTGLLTGVTLSVNWYTLSAVSFFGMPAAISLTVLKFIFR